MELQKPRWRWALRACAAATLLWLCPARAGAQLASGEIRLAVVGRVDFAEGRVHSNLTIDAGAGVDAWRQGAGRFEIRGEMINVANRLNVVNFAGLFSGTAVAPPRIAGVRARLDF